MPGQEGVPGQDGPAPGGLSPERQQTRQRRTAQRPERARAPWQRAKGTGRCYRPDLLTHEAAATSAALPPTEKAQICLPGRVVWRSTPRRQAAAVSVDTAYTLSPARCLAAKFTICGPERMHVRGGPPRPGVNAAASSSMTHCPVQGERRRRPPRHTLVLVHRWPWGQPGSTEFTRTRRESWLEGDAPHNSRRLARRSPPKQLLGRNKYEDK